MPNLKQEDEDLRTATTADSSLPTAIETSLKVSPIRFRQRPTNPTRPVDDIEYFDSLIRDLNEISRLLAKNPSLFRHAHHALMEELYSVWVRLRPVLAIPSSPHAGRPSALKRSAPPNSNSNTDVGSPPNNPHSNSSFGSPGYSPLKWQSARGDLVAPINWLGHMDINTRELPVYIHKLEKKVFIPDAENYNYIGRILGPRGISARQIEAETNCKILIRGKGSVKDPVKESQMIGQPGYEHLRENLYVHISTEGSELADCQRRLDKAVSIIESLLTPAYDEYKKTQLLQLAIINGTYRPYKKQKRRY